MGNQGWHFFGYFNALKTHGVASMHFFQRIVQLYFAGTGKGKQIGGAISMLHTTHRSTLKHGLLNLGIKKSVTEVS